MPFKIRTPMLGEYAMAVEIAPRLPQSQMADFFHPEKFPDWPDRYKPQMRYRGFRRALLSTLRDYLAEDWSTSFACAGRAAVPILVVWGREDRDVPFALSREVLAALPQAGFLPSTIRRTCPSERPEIVNPRMLDFLSALSQTVGRRPRLRRLARSGTPGPALRMSPEKADGAAAGKLWPRTRDPPRLKCVGGRSPPHFEAQDTSPRC